MEITVKQLKEILKRVPGSITMDYLRTLLNNLPENRLISETDNPLNFFRADKPKRIKLFEKE
jgi:Tat protein secretion system quality control protein TatD with DNase activity